MILVVDTNIVFSGILSPNGIISDLLLNSKDKFEFYAPAVILDELNINHQKLLRLSRLSENELHFLTSTILKKIDMIDLEVVQQQTWEKALELTKNVDQYDAPFIALSLELGSPLWTGDKKLINGLSAKGVDWILDTETIKNFRNGD
ncbi:MAG: PIN domain-containing protein [Cyclobacteriaceae bacterium]|nr:PIN domain-containing protein [Cyclobacteriaceae bacterium]